jgi:spermidine synthase
MLKRSDLFLLPFLYGLVTLGFQILFVRKLISILGPSEMGYALIITIWLLLTGLGAWLCEKTRHCYTAGYTTLTIYSFLAVILYGAIPKFHDLWGLKAGEIAGFAVLAATAFIILLPLCLFSGSLFVGIVNSISVLRKGHNVSFTYIVESLGSLVAGVIITFICFTFLADRYIALVLFILMVAVMIVKIDKRLLLAPPRITLGIMCLFAGVAFALSNFGHQFGSQMIVGNTDTPYQHLTCAEYESQFTVYSDGRKMFSYPQAEEAERIYPILWQKDSFENIALIGFCPPDKLAELSKYPRAQIDLYELDRHLYDFAIAYLPAEAANILSGQGIGYIWDDPYLAISETDRKYDFVLLNYSNPVDGVSNRYFTVDFYERIARVLKPDGIFAMIIPASGNLLRGNLKEYISILYNSLRVKFANVKIIPGEEYIFLASNDDSAIRLEINSLLRAKRLNGIETRFVDSVYLSYLLDPMMMIRTDEIYFNEIARANTISRPIVFYFNSILWAERFFKVEKSFLVFWQKHGIPLHLLLLLPALPFLFLLRRKSETPYFSLAYLAGFAGITLQMTLLVLYQSYFGNIYSRIGLLVGLFMIGLAAGGYLPYRLKREEARRKIWFCAASLLGGIIVLGLFAATRHNEIPVLRHLIILLLAFLSGGFSGFLFSFAAVSYRFKYDAERPGVFYLSDLLGSSLAGLIISVLFIPLLGFGAILLLFLILLIVYMIYHRLLIAER